MGIVISHFLKAFIASGILYTYYLLALRNKKFNFYNRWYLLMSVIISLLIPFVNFSWYQIESEQNTPLVIFFKTLNSSPVTKKAAIHFTPELIIFCSITIVSALLLIFLFSRIIWIYRIKRVGNITRMQGFDLIETNVKQAPFSFLHNLFWKYGMSMTDDIGTKIFKHELSHIRQRHSFDKLFAQIVLCIFWINPFYWIIQKELDSIHEFIADAASIEKGDTESFALMLLQAHDEGRYLSPSNSFFNSSIKRRLIMIASSKRTSFSYIRRILALPVAVSLVILFSINLKAQTDAKINRVVTNNNISLGDTTRKVDHIEVYGETGKGDTAFVYFTNGVREIYILNNSSENKIFNRKYGKLLQRPPIHLKEQLQAKPKDNATSPSYKPLNPIPESISDITFGSETIWLKLKDGTKEKYDLNNKDEIKNFESKYGELKIKKDM
jgi:hypothetical protein